MKKIDETRNYLLEEIKNNDLTYEKYKTTWKYLNYVEHLLILASTITGCVSIAVFASLVCVPVGIASPAVGIKSCAITVGIEKYKSIIRRKKILHDKIVFLGKDKLNTIEVLISKVLIDPYISHDEFVFVNNVLREYNRIKKDIKNPEFSVDSEKFRTFSFSINSVDISRKTYEWNDIEMKVDNDGILWLNEKHIEEGLGHKNLEEITTKYHLDHRKHRHELVTRPKKQWNKIFIDEKLTVKVIMDCRTTSI